MTINSIRGGQATLLGSFAKSHCGENIMISVRATVKKETLTRESIFTTKIFLMAQISKKKWVLVHRSKAELVLAHLSYCMLMDLLKTISRRIIVFALFLVHSSG